MRFFSPSAAAVVCALALASCSSSPPIERYATSKSHFSSPPKLNSHTYPEKDLYRVYERGASGFVPVSACRSGAVERATEFCEQMDRDMVILGEKNTIAFPLPGNFPAAEVVFAAAQRNKKNLSDADVSRLAKLKKLRDQDVISDEEFQQEKRRALR